MKNIMFAAVCAIGLAACGGGGGNDLEARLVASCEADGEATKEQCACMSKAAVEGLDNDLLTKVVDASEAEDSDAAMMALMGELDTEQATKFMTVMMGAMGSCDVEM